LALTRFTLAMHLTIESGILLPRAIWLSMQATGNAAFEAEGKPIETQLKRGEDLREVIKRVSVFPRDFCHALAVAEESGRLAEAMQQQCKHFQEEGERRLKGLMRAAKGGVWVVYATFMIIMIFQLAQVYFDALNKGPTR